MLYILVPFGSKVRINLSTTSETRRYIRFYYCIYSPYVSGARVVRLNVFPNGVVDLKIILSSSVPGRPLSFSTSIATFSVSSSEVQTADFGFRPNKHSERFCNVSTRFRTRLVILKGFIRCCSWNQKRPYSAASLLKYSYATAHNPLRFSPTRIPMLLPSSKCVARALFGILVRMAWCALHLQRKSQKANYKHYLQTGASQGVLDHP